MGLEHSHRRLNVVLSGRATEMSGAARAHNASLRPRSALR